MTKVSFLINYDVIRIFKTNIGSQRVLMLPPVNIDQPPDENRKIPHPAQTFLYVGEIEDTKAKEFSTSLANRLLIEGDKIVSFNQEADEHDKQKNEKEAEKTKQSTRFSGSSSGKHKGSNSGSDKKRRKQVESKSREIFTPVSRVFRECKPIGPVGGGGTGELTECDFSGVQVVVKVGNRMSYSDTVEETASST